jgi:hypothetical protein
VPGGAGRSCHCLLGRELADPGAHLVAVDTGVADRWAGVSGDMKEVAVDAQELGQALQGGAELSEPR